MSLDGSLKYWKDGEPVICEDNADIKALKYWKDGEPMGGLVYFTSAEPEGGYTRKLAGLTNIAKVNGVSLMYIANINGIEVA